MQNTEIWCIISIIKYTGGEEISGNKATAIYDNKWYDRKNCRNSRTDRTYIRSYSNYWTSTETYEALKEYILCDFDGLKDKISAMIAGESVIINTAKFQNDMVSLNSADDVLTLLVHLGYLTFRSTNTTGTGKVWIPNSEVKQEFINSIEDGGW